MGSVSLERAISGGSTLESEFRRALDEQDYARARVIMQVDGDIADAESLTETRLNESRQAHTASDAAYALMEDAAQKHLIISSDRSQLRRRVSVTPAFAGVRRNTRYTQPTTLDELETESVS